MNKSTDRRPFEKKVWLSSPTMHGEELEYVTEAYNTNWMSTVGANINEVEKIAAEKAGVKYAVALSCCTAALHLCVKLAGEKLYGKPAISHGAVEGKRVFCSDMTFDATLNPVVYEGGIPVFIDTDPDSWNMDPEALEKAFEMYPEVKLVVCAELYGFSGNIRQIKEICEKHGALLIEDAAEALGSEYNGQKCGTLGRFGALSFNGNKIITTSGGGMLLCGYEDDAKHALKLATQARENAPWYQHEEIGYNYRMSNISAGIGRGQMKVLPLRVEQKRAIYERYCEGLKGLPVTMQPQLDCAKPNRWLSTLLMDKDCGITPTDVLKHLAEHDMEGRHLWKPMNLQPVFASAPFVKVNEEAVCDDLFARGVCLPSDTKMSMDDVDRVCAAIREMF